MIINVKPTYYFSLLCDLLSIIQLLYLKPKLNLYGCSTYLYVKSIFSFKTWVSWVIVILVPTHGLMELTKHVFFFFFNSYFNNTAWLLKINKITRMLGVYILWVSQQKWDMCCSSGSLWAIYQVGLWLIFSKVFCIAVLWQHSAFTAHFLPVPQLDS